jgi:hypothetical protein
MPVSKRVCIDVAHESPIKKQDLLKLIQAELDKEFPTDVVSATSRITVTLDEHSMKVPKTGKK